MSVELTIGSETFKYPSNGENPGWGEDASDWAVKITDTVNDLSGINDILLTTASVADNQSVAQDIQGLAFDIGSVQSLEIQYFVTRSDGSTISTESGIMSGIYDGSNWKFQYDNIGDAGMEFDITSTGQVQYYSSSIGGTYSGQIQFRAKTIDQ